MRIKSLELVSIFGTGWALYNIGIDITGDINNSIYISIVAMIISYVYLRQVLDKAKAIGANIAVIIFSLPFVLFWTLNAQTAFNIYLNTYIDKNYLTYSSSYQKVIVAQKELKELNLFLLNSKDKLNFSHNANDFVLKHKSFTDKRKKELLALRKEWNNYSNRDRKKWSCKYWQIVSRAKRKLGDVGRGIEAVKNIAEYEYNIKLEELKSLDRETNRIYNNDHSITSLQAKISIKKQEIDKHKQNIKKAKIIESKAPLSLRDFYIFLFSLGVFLEIFVTHAGYWLMSRQEKDFIKSQTQRKAVDKKSMMLSRERKIWLNGTTATELIKTLEVEPKIFIELAGLTKANHELNIIFGLFRAWANNQKMTVSNSQIFSTYINKTTQEKYKIGRKFYQVRKELRENGIDVKEDTHMFSSTELIEAVRKYFEYTSM